MFDKGKNTSSTNSNELFMATRQLAAELDQMNWHYEAKRGGNLSLVEIIYSGENINAVRIACTSSENNDMQVIALNVIPSVPATKKAAVLDLLNKFNSDYRYFKFCLRDDNAVYALYDLPKIENIGKITLEIVVFLAKLIDEKYPELMKVIWN